MSDSATPAALLNRAHSPNTANAIYTSRVQQRPLAARPTSPPPPLSADARTRRQRARAVKNAIKRRKPQPLSAKEKRKLRVYEVGKSEARWDVFVGLRKLWRGYMRGVLGVRDVDGDAESSKGKSRHGTFVTAKTAGPLLASADYHGAEIEVVRSRCVSRVGVKGIVIKDTKFTFEVITPGNAVKKIPKEHTIFRFTVPLISDTELERREKEESVRQEDQLVFELHGEQFKNRAADRAKKKFRQHYDPDL